MCTYLGLLCHDMGQVHAGPGPVPLGAQSYQVGHAGQFFASITTPRDRGLGVGVGLPEEVPREGGGSFSKCKGGAARIGSQGMRNYGGPSV